MRVWCDVIKQQGSKVLLLYVWAILEQFIGFFPPKIMTILPKKKHPDGKKNEGNNGNDLRHSRSRNNCARTSGERTNRSADEINESAVYRGGNLELRGKSESSSNGKRRYRNSTNDYRRRDEAGYNSEDEYDASNSNEQPTEEVSLG